MNSSTSSSERAGARIAGYRFAAIFVAAAAGVFALLLAVTVVVDPYDSGRIALFAKPGVARQGPRTANASRGRDPAFDTAIIGNSHIQLVEPAAIDAATGLKTVSLIVPATHPREQFVVLNWFLRHHAQPKAIVIGLDDWWCLPDFRADKPFPYWLYSRSFSSYVGGLVNYSALEQVTGRLSILFGTGARARPDGWWDYEADYRAIGYGDQAFVDTKLAKPRPVTMENGGPYVAAGRLRDLMEQLPNETRVVLAWPPVYIAAQPAPGSPAEAGMRACKQTFARIASERPNTALVDWATDRPENHDRTQFFDLTHYRQTLARLFEVDIAAALTRRN